MYIIGLDVSSTRIGIAVLGANDKIEVSKVIKLKSSLTLEQRADIFKYEMAKLEKKFVPYGIYMEAPAMLFRGGSTAHVMSKLQRFNGMCSYICYEVFGDEVLQIPANKARKSLEIKIPRQKGVAKKFIIDWIKNKYGDDFNYDLTYKGNPVPGTDDRADAIVIALAGEILDLDTDEE
jgi:hypothetical protein